MFITAGDATAAGGLVKAQSGTSSGSAKTGMMVIASCERMDASGDITIGQRQAAPAVCCDRIAWLPGTGVGRRALAHCRRPVPLSPTADAHMLIVG